MAPYQKLRVDIPTAFACEDNGIWTTAPTGVQGLLDLVYIKTRKTPNNRVEVHIASASSAYQEFSEHAVSGFSTDLAGNGTWSMVDTTGDGRADLVFIKTRDPSSTMAFAEVYIALASSRFSQVLEPLKTKLEADSTATWIFTPKYVGDWTRGDDWQRGGSLGCVRHVATQSGFVELQMGGLGDGAKACDVTITKFPATKPGDTPRTYTLCEIQCSGERYGEVNLQVAWIDHRKQTHLDEQDKVRVSHADPGAKDRSICGPYDTVLSRRNTGVWQFLYHLVSLGDDYTTTTDVVHITHLNTRSGKVELEICAGSNVEDKDWVRKVTDVATKIPGTPVSKLKFWINAWAMDRDGIRQKKELRTRSDNAFARIYQTVAW